VHGDNRLGFDPRLDKAIVTVGHRYAGPDRNVLHRIFPFDFAAPWQNDKWKPSAIGRCVRNGASDQFHTPAALQPTGIQSAVQSPVYDPEHPRQP
jgi:hypothetical protein